MTAVGVGEVMPTSHADSSPGIMLRGSRVVHISTRLTDWTEFGRPLHMSWPLASSIASSRNAAAPTATTDGVQLPCC